MLSTCGSSLSWAGAQQVAKKPPIFDSSASSPAMCGLLGSLAQPARGPQAGAQALAPCLHSRVCPRREGGTGAVLGQLEQRRSPGWLGEVARQSQGAAGEAIGWGVLIVAGRESHGSHVSRTWHGVGQVSVSECVSLFNFFLFQLRSSVCVVWGGNWDHQDGEGCQRSGNRGRGHPSLASALLCSLVLNFFHLKPLACTKCPFTQVPLSQLSPGWPHTDTCSLHPQSLFPTHCWIWGWVFLYNAPYDSSYNRNDP